MTRACDVFPNAEGAAEEARQGFGQLAGRNGAS